MQPQKGTDHETYFVRKSARELAETLGISDEAAQKRVHRAVERLRAFFAQRGVSASRLVVVLSVHAVEAAPAGLAVTISAAAALAGTTIDATATTTAATAAMKAIVMITLQKTLIAATFVAAVGTGIYEGRQASVLRSRVQELQDQADQPGVEPGLRCPAHD